MQVAIIGAGNFGTAVANIVSGNGVPAYLWMRDPQQFDDIEKYGENRRYLSGYPLEEKVTPTLDLQLAVSKSDLIFVTVPSASFREMAVELAPFVSKDTYVVSGTKGVEAPNLSLMSQILEEELPDCPIGVISGPNIAEEIAGGHFTGTVVASRDSGLCDCVQTVFASDSFRVYSSEDIYGVELGGALKNIYAIVCGIAARLEVGQNTVAMLITRSLAEMSRFAEAMGANPYTFLGLAGVGDLMVTCTSPLSRNYQLGFRIAGGRSLSEAMDELGKLAEGVNTLQVVHEKREQLGVYMPLAEALFHVLFEQGSIDQVVSGLMTGEQQVDVEFANPTTWSAPN
ncbi:MAG: NAD(P)H-dependent glycerol-3-phosphate dehydrogenase [Pseudomonadota bacterium]|nr:NAD(P)H-dependent glycerol-3-phosphate dehydrogenase [Pseudomonadota bacterium]